MRLRIQHRSRPLSRRTRDRAIFPSRTRKGGFTDRLAFFHGQFHPAQRFEATAHALGQAHAGSFGGQCITKNGPNFFFHEATMPGGLYTQLLLEGFVQVAECQRGHGECLHKMLEL